MALELKTREQFVADEIAAIQAALPGNFQFPIGSIVLAIVDAHSATAMWEESLVQFVLARTRLATSTGQYADSFVEDFGLERREGDPASDNVTFASFTSTTQRLIEVGKTVSTPDGSVTFAVIADTTNPNFNPALNAYVMNIGISSTLAKVQATVNGTIGNVAVGRITVINSPITGVDTVNNAQAFTNGKNAQTDPELRQYFVDYLNSLYRATKDAIDFAALSAKGVTEVVSVENINYDDDEPLLGYFYVVINDGTGSPSNELVESVKNAVEKYRGFTIRYDVKPCLPLTVNISANIVIPNGTLNPNYNPNLINDIETAIDIYIKLIPMGETLFYTRIAQIIYNVINQDLAPIQEQVNVTGIQVNSGTSDIDSTPKQKFIVGTISIFIVSS